VTTTAEPTAGPGYASPVDCDAYGQYGAGRGFDSGQAFQRPRYPFRGRITADGSSGYRAEPGRHHPVTPSQGDWDAAADRKLLS
jgi:glutathionyl-hydroquinone reductase